MTHPRHIAAFTLFEVALSLGLVAFGVVSVLMLLPAGLKAQQLSRFQILAAAKAEEMVEAFVAAPNGNPALDTEGMTLYDVALAHRAETWDLESRLSSHRFGLMPLPVELARRLDSDGDEIKDILDQGGYVYYSQPLASTNTEEQGQAVAPPNEAQRLIIGISGFAQQNCMHSLQLKNWPYHTPMPSPPLHTFHMADLWLPQRDYTQSSYWNYNVWPWPDYEYQSGPDWRNKVECWCMPWETAPGNGDPDIQKVYDWPDENNVHCGYFPYACGRLWDWPSGDHVFNATQLVPPSQPGQPVSAAALLGDYPSRPGVLRYVAATLWYAQRKGFGPSALATVDDPHRPFTSADERERWKEVQAFRFLAHAATCLTSWYSFSAPSEDDDLQRGVRIPVVNLAGLPSPSDMRITHQLITYYHERATWLVNQFASSYPYDWAVPRPLNRVTMMDYPLLQSDIFTPPLPEGLPANPLYGADWNRFIGRPVDDHPHNWRVLSPEPVRNVGVSQTYPASPINPTMRDNGYEPTSQFGDISHFNLTEPFEAAERCRQIVMWVVDWQSYEDFETLPSAPVDASKYPIAGPRSGWHENNDKPVTSIVHSFDARMVDLEFRDEQMWTYRNPEKTIMFWTGNPSGTVVDPRTLPTGTDVTPYMVLNDNGTGDWTNEYPDKGPSLEARKVFNGLYGADRNFNRKLDRGPVPKSVRMRATTITRLNFYDPRVQAILR